MCVVLQAHWQQDGEFGGREREGRKHTSAGRAACLSTDRPWHKRHCGCAGGKGTSPATSNDPHNPPVCCRGAGLAARRKSIALPPSTFRSLSGDLEPQIRQVNTAASILWGQAACQGRLPRARSASRLPLPGCSAAHRTRASSPPASWTGALAVQDARLARFPA